MARKPTEYAIPRGVKIRELKEGSRIQIAFSFEGVECRELLPMARINKSYIDYAANLRAEIIRKISDGSFRYEVFFPDSAKAKLIAPEIKPLTMGDLLRSQLAIYSKQGENGTLAASTLLGYTKAINNRLIPEFGTKSLSQMTPTVLREWVANMGVTAKTVRNALIPLRSTLDDAVNDELIDSNPLDRIALNKLLRQTATKSEYIVEPFDSDEIEALFKACRIDERPIMQFWFATGVRHGELIALEWKNVDWIHKSVRIDSNVVQGISNGKVTHVTKAPKTEAGIRDIELSESALSALVAQKAVTFLEGGKVWQNPRSGKPWESDAQIRKTLWEPLVKRAGVRYRNPYQVRHTFASTLLTAGSNPFWVASQMGHVDVEMVFKRYGKWISSNYRKAGLEASKNPAVG